MRPPSVNVAGDRRDRARDDVGGDARHRALAVDRAAVRLEHVERALGVEGDADVGEHLEGRLVDAAHVVGGEDVESPAGADEMGVGVAHAAPFARVHSRATKGEVTARTRAS